MSARYKPGPDHLTDAEAIRFAYHQGYLFALDEVANALNKPLGERMTSVRSVLDKLRAASAAINARAAIAKATGAAQ